jgi:predicted permease
MRALLADLRFAVRSLRRRPTFTAVALATIALAIGAATTIYGVVDGVLFRSLPYRDGDRILSVWQTDATRKTRMLLAASWDQMTLDYTDFIAWRARQTSFSAVGVWSRFRRVLTTPGGFEQVDGTRVSPGLFELLGVRPVLGRTFLPGEDVPNGPHVAMLSYETWQTRFGGRRDVIGRALQFDDGPYEIVGVLPPRATLVRGEPGAPFWIPAGQAVGDIGKHNHSFLAVGRLRPGVSAAQAALEAEQLLGAGDPGSHRGARVTDFVRDETRTVRAPLLLLLGAVGLLLLVACVNVATLLLGEAAHRGAEMSARVAIGASRTRLVRQLLTESALLSGAGAALGALLALWGTKAIVALAPARIPGLGGVHVDARVLGVSFLAAAAAALLFGIVPALTLADAGPAALLRAGHVADGRGRLQRTLIAVELALSMVLLVGAGLLARSLQALSSVDPGFRAEGVLTAAVTMRGKYWEDTLRLRAFQERVVPRVRAIPGVTAVSMTTSPPFSGRSSSSPVLLPGEGDAERGAHKHELEQRTVAPNYFATLGIPLLAGRAFTDADRAGAPLVAVISEAAARRDFPTESALGKQVLWQGAWRTIVGVVADVKVSTLAGEARPSIYVPLAQDVDLPDLVLRTQGDPSSVATAVRAAVREVDPTFLAADAESMTARVRRSFAEERFRTALVLLFGAMALVLSAVGTYGVTARAVGRRTREVGIRLAVGAPARSVVALVVTGTLRGVVVGVAAGTVGALAASRLLAPYLYAVTPHDPATYAAIVGFLAAVSVLASWIPARRAGRVAPASVLRGD